MSQYSNHPQYGSAPLQEAQGATTGLVLGILSIVFVIPLLGLIMPFIGLGMSRSAKAVVDANPGAYSNGGLRLQHHRADPQRVQYAVRLRILYLRGSRDRWSGCKWRRWWRLLMHDASAGSVL